MKSKTIKIYCFYLSEALLPEGEKKESSKLTLQEDMAKPNRVINMQILQVSRCELSVTVITTVISQRLYMRNKNAAWLVHSKTFV